MRAFTNFQKFEGEAKIFGKLAKRSMSSKDFYRFLFKLYGCAPRTNKISENWWTTFFSFGTFHS